MKPDLAAIEHAEHELDLARAKLRALRVAALVSMGWTVKRERERCFCEDEKPTGVAEQAMFNAHRVSRRCVWRNREYRVWYYPPAGSIPQDRRRRRTRYWNLCEAFNLMRGQARRKCGDLSCERKPRRKVA